MEILDKMFKRLGHFMDNDIVALTGVFCVLLFISFWLIIFLIYTPIKWLWVNKIKQGVTNSK